MQEKSNDFVIMILYIYIYKYTVYLQHIKQVYYKIY